MPRETVHNCVFRNIWQRAIKSVQIRVVRDNPGLVVAHNVIAGPPPQIESEDKTQVLLRENRHGVALSLFGEPEAGDLRLRLREELEVQ